MDPGLYKKYQKLISKLWGLHHHHINTVMEKERKIFTFEKNPCEDFRLWQARTQAALESKEILMVVEQDIIGGGKDEGKAVWVLPYVVYLRVSKARALITRHPVQNSLTCVYQ